MVTRVSRIRVISLPLALMKPGMFLMLGMTVMDVGLFAGLWYFLSPSINNLSIPLFAILFTTIGAVFMGAGYIAEQIVNALSDRVKTTSKSG